MSSLPRLVRLAILDTYGVEWPLATFARDVVQNFFDVALSFRDVVFERDDAARTLTIRGPVEFDLELLAYVGATTKLDGKTAGGFGEGFKICALVGVRDHGLAIRAGSGETEIEVAFEPVPLGRELCYHVHTAPGGKGSFVRLEGCTDAVFAAFETARHQFYHEDNSHLGALVATDEGRTVAVHLAAPGEKHGEIYYRRQFRGDIAYSGDRAGPVMRLTIACHHAVDNLEGDRDRRILDPQTVARVIGERLPPEGIQQAVLLLMAEWTHGHDVLYGLVLAAIGRKLRFEWPDDWIARSSRSGDQALMRAAERKGFKVAVAEFSQIGMKTAKDVLRIEKGKISVPTPAESARIEVVIALYGALSGDDPPGQTWKIYDGKKGEAVHRHHDGRELFVASRLLEADGFVLGASAVLHELAHEFGAEDSAGFLNRLGRLVGGAIRDPAAIAAARANFERALPKGRRVAEVEEVEPYKPEFVLQPPGAKRYPLHVKVCVPPGFPPTTALVDRLHEGAAAADFGCYPSVYEVGTLAEARQHKVRGIPCVKVGETEVDPSGASGRYGLRLRTYGPERDILPSVEMVAAAFRAHMDEFRAQYRPGMTQEQQLAHRDSMAKFHCSQWAKATAKGTWREQLESAFTHACAVHLDAVKKGIEQTEEQLCAVVQADVLRMKEAADAHLAAQTDFDPGDGFEEDALRFAHTVFMVGFAAGGASRAARDFAVVREATKELLAVDLGAEMREGVLAWCLERMGAKAQFRGGPIKPLDEAAFRAAFTTALGEARRLQRALDRDERSLRGYELRRRLDSAMLTPSEREEARVQKLGQSAVSARWRRRQRMRAALTHTIKETWERTLAETGSGVTAGEACIALLRRLDNELTAEERRAKKGAA